ncbi:MAG: 60S ribosomal protein L31 [Nanoarchaeota archaeon]|nr:60S ribosomal protein L31 [Nanoarchaeota archaeon]
MVKDFEIRRYNIHLTKDVSRVPINRKASRAIVTIKKFIEKNTRAEKGSVLIGNELNEALWNRSRSRPPAKVSVFVQNLKDGKVFVNLEGAPLYVKKEKKEKKEKEDKKGKGLEELTEDFKTDKEKEEGKKDKKKESEKKEKVAVKTEKKSEPKKKTAKPKKK